MPPAPVLLLDPINRRLVELCIPARQTLSALSQQLQTDMNQVYYRTRQLLAADILQVEASEKRAGRAIKHYRATRQQYFVPFASTPYQDMVEYCHGLTAPSLHAFWTSAFQKARDLEGEWGLSMAYDPHRAGLVLQIQRETDTHLQHNPIEQWASENHILATFDQLRLSEAQASEMYQALLEVYRKFVRQQSPDGQVHWVGLFFGEKDR